MRFDFAGVERKRAAFKPTQRSGYTFAARLFGKLFDEPMQPGAILRAHMHELHAHAVTGASVADDGTRAHFAPGYVEQQLDVRARGKGIRDKKKCSADTQLLGVRDVALSGALPCDKQVFGRPVPRVAAAFVFWNFDGKSFASRFVWSGPEGKGWCRMTHL